MKLAMSRINRFIECHIPITRCNLRCHYCYITKEQKYDDIMPVFPHSPKEIANKLSKKKMGGSCMMNICGAGETMLPKEITDIVYFFLKEGHYVTIVTNGLISNRINEICSFPKKYLNRVFFKISFHYFELIRLKLLEVFFNNVKTIKKNKTSFAVEITPCDELIPYIDEIKCISLKELGALPHITIARDETKEEIPILSKYSNAEFYDIWKVFDSKMLDFKISVYGQKREEFCNAGLKSFCVNLSTGDASQCYYGDYIGNIFNDKKINFKPVGKNCKLPHCFNAHSFLLWGVIKDFTNLTYTDIRNRICMDGSEWLTHEIKKIMQTKLSN